MEDKDNEKKPSAFERRIKLLKLLQGREMRIKDLVAKFNVDDRTIRNDIYALREGMDVLGTIVKINSKHEGTQKQYYTSTVHPIFLALNLSELTALLMLLEREADIRPTGDIYGKIFRKIYNQLTAYAENKIRHTLKGSYPKDTTINTLEENEYKNVWYAIKSGEKIKTTYKDKEGNEVTKAVRWTDINGIMLKIEDGDEVLWVDFRSIKADWDRFKYK